MASSYQLSPCFEGGYDGVTACGVRKRGRGGGESVFGLDLIPG